MFGSHSFPNSLAVLIAVVVSAASVAISWAPSGAQQRPLLITGATRVEVDDSGGVWDLAGNPVTVRRGFVVLQAPTIRYQVKDQVVVASGGVSYSDDLLTASAGSMTMWIPQERVVAEEGVQVLYRGGEPVELRAQQVEVRQRQRRVAASGEVRLTQGTSTITADLIEYDETTRLATASGAAQVRTPEGRLGADRIQASLRADEVIADGHVVISRGDLDARAARAVLQQQASLVALSGGAVVRLGSNTIAASTVTVDLRARRVTATGGAHLVASPTAPP